MSDRPGTPSDTRHVTQDFIFGDLSSGETLVRQLTEQGTGLRHGNRTLPAVPVPGRPVTIECSVGENVSIAAMAAYCTTDGSLPDETSRSVAMTRHEVDWRELNWAYGERWRGELPAHDAGTLVRYRIRATTSRGETIWADPNPHSGEPGLFAYWLGNTSAPGWLREAVIYHIFVDRFATTGGVPFRDDATLAGFFGGTIDGVRESLDYLRDLGVTCLWLSPVFPSPSHHGYDASDYVSVEPRLGTLDGLRALVEAAHARGMRVLLDFVANHGSDKHPLFRNAVAQSDAPQRALFHFSGDSYASYFNVGTMPEFALDRPEALAYMLDAARFWIELSVDGYRLDYAMGPSHAFWSAFRQAVREAKPDAALIGEITGSATQLRSYEGRLDGALDFLLLQDLRAFLAFDLIDAAAFGRFVERHGAYFADGFVLPSFLDNHDMNRFLWAARGATRRLKLAALVQFMLPGPPIVYYGTEVGVSQARDIEYPDGSRKPEESRSLMIWGGARDADLLAFYQRLIALRKRLLASLAVPVAVDSGDPDVLMLAVGEGLHVAVNRSPSARRVTLPGGSITVTIATEEGVEALEDAIYLPPMTGALLTTR